MDVNAVLYSGCMAAAPQLFDTTVRQQEADNDDDDNVVGDWDPDDIWLWGGVAENNDQEIAANIRGEEDSVEFYDEGGESVDNEFIFDTTVRQQEADDGDDYNVVGDCDPGNLVVGGSVDENNDQASIRGEEDNVDFNDEGEKGVDKEFNNLCNKDDTYDDTDLVVGVGVAGNNNQKRAAEQEAPQATYKAELVTGKKRSDYLMRKLTIEEEDTVEWALSPGALLPSSLNQKDLLTIAGRKGEGKLNTTILNMYTQVVLKQRDKKLCLQEQERSQLLLYKSEFINKYFDKTNIGSYH
jgi:hypothetical protein